MGAVIDVELAENAPHMRLHRVLGDLEVPGDLLVRVARSDELEDADLGLAQQFVGGVGHDLLDDLR
jgi:hypothetical protein